jgi:predicted transcriptional regulator
MRSLGDLEAAIMDRVWRWDRPTTIRELVDDLNMERPLAYTTVSTVVEVLHRKGWLNRSKNGRAFEYAAAKSRDEYVAGLMREALTATKSRRATFAHFVDDMSAAEVRAMREALESRKGAGSARGRRS